MHAGGQCPLTSRSGAQITLQPGGRALVSAKRMGSTPADSVRRVRPAAMSITGGAKTEGRRTRLGDHKAAGQHAGGRAMPADTPIGYGAMR